MKTCAVVGSGCAGLACAHALAKAGVRVTLDESDAQFGGHARTMMVEGVPVDVGFMVCNRVTYPNMVRAERRRDGCDNRCFGPSRRAPVAVARHSRVTRRDTDCAGLCCAGSWPGSRSWAWRWRTLTCPSQSRAGTVPRCVAHTHAPQSRSAGGAARTHECLCSPVLVPQVEWGSGGLSALFAQPSNVASPAFLTMLAEMPRFQTAVLRYAQISLHPLVLCSSPHVRLLAATCATPPARHRLWARSPPRTARASSWTTIWFQSAARSGARRAARCSTATRTPSCHS